MRNLNFKTKYKYPWRKRKYWFIYETCRTSKCLLELFTVWQLFTLKN